MTRVALVSGANRGIGLAIARRLHADGLHLSLGARDPAALERATAGFDPGRTLRNRFDADEPASAETWVAATLARWGRLDVLVNNAGILRMVNFDTGTEAELDQLWNTNVKAAFRMIRLALPHLRQSGRGRIVNIASTDAKRVRDYTSSIGYAMSKHALLALSHAAKFAGWEAGVRVTAICPGAVDTELVQGVPGLGVAAVLLSPQTIADAVAYVIGLPNEASVAELVITSRLESTL